ncbi:MAG: glycosyltransferase family 39 protein [candidate division Zixibacteria bacterium]|nr:glycosyltransferase family 39 protein [candidate division Zixibacteria bacterium]
MMDVLVLLLRQVSDPRKLSVLALSLFALAHLYQISAPPNGYHQWRESDTAAVALNYSQEDFNILRPRINQRGAGSGITGMEIPAYTYSVAILYKIFGPHHFLPRSVTLCLGLLGLWWFARIVELIWGKAAAPFALWALAFSPLYFFYAFKIMPDMTMISLLLGAVYYFVRYIGTAKTTDLAISCALLVVSACLKPVGLALYLPFLWILWRKSRRRKKRLLHFGGYIALSFSLVMVWFDYARGVNEVHGNPGFYLGETFWDFPETWFSMKHIKKVFLQWPPELWIGWGMLPAFIIGVFQSLKRKTGGVFLLWIIAGYIVLGLTSQLSTNHDYYSLVIVPAFAALTGFGLWWMNLSGGWKRGIAVILMIIAPVASFIRISHRFSDVPEFADIRADTAEYIMPGALVMVEDPTQAIRLYQLNRHGWPLRHGIKSDVIARNIESGAEFLVLENSFDRYGQTDALARLIETDSLFRLAKLYGYPVRQTLP